MNKTTDLSTYNNAHYQSGSTLKKTLWYFTNMFIFKTMFPFPSKLKVTILKQFGTKIGYNVTIKPNVNIKYPWFLEIGSHVWIGEGVWIDNLAQVNIGNNVCISQDAYLLTGSHKYKKSSFDLILGSFVTSFRIPADHDTILRFLGIQKISTVYLPQVMVKMRLGGESNKSLANLKKKTAEDIKVLRKNGIGGYGTIVMKNLSKTLQFIVK